jgi:hypothetical protein
MHQSRPEDQSCRAVQQYPAAAGVSARARGAVIFQEARQSYRGPQTLHLSLQPHSDRSITWISLSRQAWAQERAEREEPQGPGGQWTPPQGAHPAGPRASGAGASNGAGGFRGYCHNGFPSQLQDSPAPLPPSSWGIAALPRDAAAAIVAEAPLPRPPGSPGDRGAHGALVSSRRRAS